MIIVHIKIYILHECFKVIIICGLEFLPNSVFFCFNVELLILAIAEHIAKHINCVWHVVLKSKHMIECKFPWGVGIKLVAPVFDFSLKLISWPPGSAFKVQVFKEVSLTRIFFLFVSGTSINENTYSSYLTERWLSHNLNSIRYCCDFIWSIILQWLWYFTKFNVIKLFEHAWVKLICLDDLRRGCLLRKPLSLYVKH